MKHFVVWLPVYILESYAPIASLCINAVFFEDKSRSITFWIVFQSFQPFSLADLRYIAEINARIKGDSPPAVFEHYILDLSQARKAAAPNIQALKTAKLSYRIHVCGRVIFEENSLPLFEEGTTDRPFALMLLWAHYAMICDLQDMNRV